MKMTDQALDSCNKGKSSNKTSEMQIKGNGKEFGELTGQQLAGGDIALRSTRKPSGVRRPARPVSSTKMRADSVGFFPMSLASIERSYGFPNLDRIRSWTNV